jgi:hypothetical protein
MMSPATKLWLRKRALMLLRAIVWRVDDWLHRQEVALRDELVLQNAVHGHREVAGRAELRKAASPARSFGADSSKSTERPVHQETFQQWEARRSGVAVISKKSARRRMTAAAFDARFAR